MTSQFVIQARKGRAKALNALNKSVTHRTARPRRRGGLSVFPPIGRILRRLNDRAMSLAA